MFPGRNSHIRQHRALFIVKLQVTHIRHALTLYTELLSRSNLVAFCQKATVLFVAVNFGFFFSSDCENGALLPVRCPRANLVNFGKSQQCSHAASLNRK